MRLNFLIAFFLLTAFIVDVHPQRAKTPDLSNKKLTSELDVMLEEVRSKSLIPGFAVAFVDERGTVYEKGFGSSDLSRKVSYTPRTIGQVASVSKTFIALAVMKLVEQKKLGLDEPVNSILPFKIVNPYFPDAAITVRHLVTHTSSITDSFEPYSVGEADVVLEDPNDKTIVPEYIRPNVEWHRMSRKISLDESIRKFTVANGKWYSDATFLKSAPGTRYQYSNVAASVAARIVEERSGMSFDDFSRKYIFAPLKMNDTSWNYAGLDERRISRIYVHNAEKDATGVAAYPRYYVDNYPSSGLKTTVADLAAFVVEMIRGSNGNGRLLKSETYRAMFESQLSPTRFPKLDRDGDTEEIAVFWRITKDGNREHLGGNTGVSAFARFDPKTKTGAVGICNLRDDSFGDVKSIIDEFQPKFARR